MAIDTVNKRRSVDGYTLPLADGSVATIDRIAIGGGYPFGTSGQNYSVIVSDTAHPSDGWKRSFSRSLLNSCSSYDIVYKRTNRNCSDTIRASDILSRAIRKSIADSAQTADSTQRAAVYYRLISNNVSITDFIHRSFSRRLSDFLQSIDSTTIRQSVQKRVKLHGILARVAIGGRITRVDTKGKLIRNNIKGIIE